VRSLALLIAVGSALTACTSVQQPATFSNFSGPNSVGSLGEPYTELRGLAAVSPTDVWAVGIRHDAVGDQSRIEHWNGGSVDGCACRAEWWQTGRV